MSTVMPHPAQKIKRFPRTGRTLSVLVCALWLLWAPAVTAAELDHAWLSITLDTLIHDELAWGADSIQSLEQFLHQRAADFGITLSNRLAEQRPALALRLLPTAPDAAHLRLREEGAKNTLLITVDISSDYGRSPFAPGAVPLSIFWPTPPDMVKYVLHSEGTLKAVFFDADAEPQLLFDARHIPLEEHFETDFSIVGDSAAEWDRLTELTDTLLRRLLERALTELTALPADLSSPREPPALAAFPFLAQVQSDRGRGSAFVISHRGFAVTSLHVIEDAERLTLEWSNGKRLAAFVVARLPQYDLAVLSFPHRDEEPAEFGADAGLSPTSTLRVIGFPGATPTVSEARYQGREQHQQTEIIRIAAALEPGYSGAPVLDIDGRVVGMTISRDAHQPGIGYIIPATTLRAAVAPWRDLPRASWARGQDGKNVRRGASEADAERKRD